MRRFLKSSSALALAGVALVFAASPFACGGDDSTNGNNTGGSGATGGSTTGTGGTTTTTSSGGGTTSTTSSGGGNGGNAGGAGGAGASGGSGGAGATGGNGGSGGQIQVDDADGDGWTIADGDCCDDAVSGCAAEPEKVNPGAFEYLGNGVDDDCDPATPDDVAVADCGGAPLQTPTTSIELVKAMDLCQFTSENVPLNQKKWGVLESALVLADGNLPAPDDVQVGVLGGFGQNVAPKKGGTFAAISTGTARAEGDPGYIHPQNGTAAQMGNYDAGTSSPVPPNWLALNGGALPQSNNCPACAGANCLTAFDPVNLRIKIRVPTNAEGFSYNFKFYTAEYPEYICQTYNDFFVALLTSSHPDLPQDAPDTNIAFDSLHNAVSVNNGFLDVCFPSGASTCPAGTLELIGNGMGGWAGNLKDGGGTQWLVNEAPVVPGESITIEFVTWDGAGALPDHNVDSIVLLDKFKWNLTPTTVGTHL